MKISYLKDIRRFTIICFGLVFTFISTAQIIDTTAFSIQTFPEEGFTLAMRDQGKALKYFKDRADHYLTEKDTANYIHCMVGLAHIEQNRGNYNKAFDIVWNTLPLTNDVPDKFPVLKLYRKLGLLYGIYGKDSLALHYLNKGLEIGKVFHNAKENPLAKLTSGYFSIANQYIKMNDYNTALTYLDSCYIDQSSDQRHYYADALYGHVYTQKGNYLKAETYLNNIIPFFEQQTHGYQAKANAYIADLKLATGEQDSAIYYYERSLRAIDSLMVHNEIKPDVLEKLALLYYSKNDRSKAFKYMQGAKFMSDSLFNTQSRHNKSLFEIKNQYQKDLSKQKELILAQNNLLELKDKAGFRLKLLIGILLVLIIITLITYRLKTRMKRMVYEQSVVQEKNEAILEAKNKELTANALQIIEKEHTVTELLDALKASDPDKYRTLSSQHKRDNKKLWEDFNLRFAKVNNKFYARLLELHSDLTPTDLKLCALIKLNFDSKEMSQILAISTHGVHTARSRVRKKLGLSREDSLSNYIATIVQKEAS
ncbi:tetratricopeptide repeat protein [Seonamhaeicola sp.]|uniref:tetratricopeptide repeat protein n=1 Tax=Seonamhaeicola sp. TaxID=1912245 RepID=UPI002625CC7D|nr:tetratricopeptide repeat protein [Seonamhaeicola sp.]